MMTTSFTLFLKKRWRMLVPLLFFTVFSFTQSFASCDKTIEDFTLRLICDGTFTIAADGVESIKVAGTKFGSPGTSTSFVDATSTPVSFLDFYQPNDTFWIEITCVKSGATHSQSIEGVFPNYNKMTGVGAGTYKFNANGTPKTATAIPNAGRININARAYKPSCETSSNGRIDYTITENISPVKCEGASIIVQLKQGTSVVATQSVKLDSLLSSYTFSGLTSGEYRIMTMLDKGSCPCKFSDVVDPDPIIIAVPAGTTVSMSCIDDVNVSLSSEDCGVQINMNDIFLNISDPCDPLAKADSFVVKFGNAIVGSGSGLLPAFIPDAMPFLDKALTVEVYDKESGNHCWGSVWIEDKQAPVLSCDQAGPIIVRCLEFSGDRDAFINNDFVNDNVWDCSQPVTLLNPLTNTIPINCDDHPYTLEAFTLTYSARDAKGNVSPQSCTDTVIIERIGRDIGDGVLGFAEGITLMWPANYVTNGISTDSLPLECEDPSIAYITDAKGVYTAPISPAMGGTGYPVLKYKDSKGINRTSILFPRGYPNATAAQNKIVRDLVNSCRIQVTYSDSPVIDFQCKKKFIRTWTIQEWSDCEGELITTYNQTITIADHVPPFFVDKIGDFTRTVLPNECFSPMLVPNPRIDDACDEIENLRLQVAIYNQDWLLIGSLGSNNPNRSYDFPYGLNYIVYTASDNCGNSAMDTVAVDVTDDTPPQIVAVDELVVGLSGSAPIRVPATSFDRGTVDGCGLEQICVVRMDDFDLLASLPKDADGDVLFDRFRDQVACGRDYSEYAFLKGNRYYINEHVICTPYVTFCCEDNVAKPNGDSADPIMVRFMAKDIRGNKAAVMVLVTLQDKNVPTIICPDDVEVLCSATNLETKTLEPFYGKWLRVSKDASLNQDPLAELFGYIVPQDDVMTIGAVAQGIATNAGNRLDGVVFDNCDDPVIEVMIAGSIDRCGVGVVTRTFRATDSDGNRSVTCVQRIYPRVLLPDDYDIVWPNPDTLLTGCLDPDNLTEESFGEPVLRNTVGCSDVFFSYDDQIFRFNNINDNNTACFKIVRTWTAIDWCRKANGRGLEIGGPFTQIIKVNDPDGPELLSVPRDTMLMLTSCEGTTIDFMISADDECTNAIDRIWNATIFKNGSFDKTVNLVSTTANSVKLSYFFDFGTYRIEYTVRDRCGNETSHTQRITVINVKKPTPVAVDLSTALMPTGGMVEIWARDFERSSSMPCDRPYSDLEFFIGKTSNFADAKSSLTYTCAQMSAAGSIDKDSVVIYFFAAYRDTLNTGKGTTNVQANASYIFQYTTTKLRISDNDGNCEFVTGANAFIAGNIHTENKENIPNISVNLRGGNQGASAIESSMTDAGGDYAFPAMSIGGKYIIDPVSDDNYLNGVSTLDLVLIQRYILGLYDIESAYRLIAADINKDGSITGLDLVDLRSTILGFKNSFTNNTSWRFIDENYKFEDASNPFDEKFTETYAIDELTTNMSVNFIGLKVGDVNGSASAQSVVAKARSTYQMTTEDRQLIKGQKTNITLVASSDEALVGTQFTLQFDARALSFDHAEGGAFALAAQHINTDRVNEGLISVSWNDINAIAINKGDDLITFTFNVLSDVKTSSSIAITSEVTSAEAYNENLETKNLQLLFSQEGLTDGFELYQNSPNPFADYTLINFNLPKASSATITIGDVTGKVVRVIRGDYKKGLNSIKLHKSDISDAGMFYYTLEAEGYSGTKRMVVLK